MDGFGLDKNVASNKSYINGHDIFTNAIYLENELYSIKDLNNYQFMDVHILQNFWVDFN